MFRFCRLHLAMIILCVACYPTLLFMGSTLYLSLGKLVCSELIFTFSLLLYPLGKEFHGEIFLSDSNLCVPLGVFSNLTSLVHYTTIDTFINPNPNQATPSTNIMVQNCFHHTSISTNLNLNPSSKYLMHTFLFK